MSTLIYHIRAAAKKLLSHHIFKDSVAIGLAQILVIIISMLLGVIIARSLSLADMGRYQLVISYLAIANIIALYTKSPKIYCRMATPAIGAVSVLKIRGPNTKDSNACD